MWSKGVGAVCILVTREVSFTLVNVYKLTDRKEGIKILQNSSCISQHRVKLCKPWLSSTFCWLPRTRDSRTWRKQVVYVKSYRFLTFSRRQAGKQASRQAGKQASRQAGKQTNQNKRKRKYKNERSKKTIHMLNKLYIVKQFQLERFST